jgi:predicted TIM-barrel fold metal-dependent hydrolase
MIKLINVHCHLLNFQFISPTCLKSRSACLEWMLRHGKTRPLVRLVAGLTPGQNLKRLHQAYDLMKMDIEAVAKQLRVEMNQAGIQLAVPMIMDMGRAAFTENPQIPFNFQLKKVSDISLEHLGSIIPFAMVDPRRTRAFDLLLRCLEELGFLGLKMYPALGYHPDPSSIYNDPQTNDELNKIYDYCESHRVPITIHCSPGGAYSNDILRHKAVRAELTRPSNWAGVLRRYPRLYLNLAHFGQDLESIKDPKSWAFEIRELIRTYPGVYTDVAYNKSALMARTSPAYVAALADILDNDRILRDRVLFGTDWSMTRHTWTEQEYVQPFLRLGEERLHLIGFENALDFLFPERRYPERLARFLKEHGRSVSDLPKWLVANLSFVPARV